MAMELAQTVGTLNLLGDESRLRLCALLRERELTVSDLVRVTGISQSRVSNHLARLRDSGFVRDRRDGVHAYYALAADRITGTAKLVLDEAALAGDPTLTSDRKRLEELGRFPDAMAGEMERHYSPGRTWPSLLSGFAALLRLGRVLDVGSGDGAAARLIAPYALSMTCIDASARMIAAARKRDWGELPFEGVVGDAHELPFEDESFEDVLLFHTLTYVDEPRRVVEECARVLRPFGRLVILSLAPHEHSELTADYGERHPGFSPAELRKMLTRTKLEVAHSGISTRETKKPHFETVLAVADKPGPNRKATAKPAKVNATRKKA